MDLQRPLDEVVLQYRPTPEQVPWIGGADKTAKPGVLHKAYPPESDGMTDYERKVPEIWDSTDKDDLLMKSLIKTYALEGRDADGPTGKFYLRESDFYKVSQEVVNTHLGFTGAKLTDYLNEHVPRVFHHFDNIGKGYLVVEEAPQALHMILQEVEIGNGLQVQLDEDVSKSYRPNPVQSPWAASPSPPPPSTKITGGFAADHAVHHLNYDREVPDKYSDDLFLKSLINKWAIEGKGDDGNKNGHFFMTKDLTH